MLNRFGHIQFVIGALKALLYIFISVYSDSSSIVVHYFCDFVIFSLTYFPPLICSFLIVTNWIKTL